MAIHIETERLVLRQFVESDAEDVLRFGSHPEVTRYTGDANEMKTLDDALNVIRDTWYVDYKTHGYGRLAVELKTTGDVIGFSGLKFLPEFDRADIGYRLLPEHWGRGIATESGRAVLKHGREELGLRNIMGIVMLENVASQRVLEKLDFKIAEQQVLDGHDVFIYEEA